MNTDAPSRAWLVQTAAAASTMIFNDIVVDNLPTITLSNANSSFTVQVKDSSGTATKALTLVVAAPAVVITTDSLPAAEQGAPYAQSLSASGGAG